MKSEGKLIPLNDAEVAYFKEQVKKMDEDVRVIDLIRRKLYANGIYGHCFRDRCGFAESDVRTKKYEEVGEVEIYRVIFLSGWEEIMIKSRQNRERRFSWIWKRNKIR